MSISVQVDIDRPGVNVPWRPGTFAILFFYFFIFLEYAVGGVIQK